jgi:serine/threonine protein kinase
MAIFDLPGYDILEKVGEGGMATVWRAHQTSLDRDVAIKILLKGLSENEDDRQRFKQEIRSAARISHPHVVHAYDAGEHAGLVYLIMEFVNGCTISDLLDTEATGLEEKQALFICERTADALLFCWDNYRIIHCDLKPENVMLDGQGAVKIADLGLARMIGLTEFNEDDELTIGTPQYMSPEQALGETELDCRSDIYALGAMLYHMVTGIAPFESYEPEAVLKMQLSDTIQDPTLCNPNVSASIAWLIEKMMMKDRTLRHQNWAEVITDLQLVRDGYMIKGGVLIGTSTIHRAPSRVEPPKKRAAKKVIKAKPEGKKKLVLNQGQVKRMKIAQAAERETTSDTTAPAFRPRMLNDAIRGAWTLLVTMVVLIFLYGFTAVRSAKQTANPSEPSTPHSP